jgi:hypothetical protein
LGDSCDEVKSVTQEVLTEFPSWMFVSCPKPLKAFQPACGYAERLDKEYSISSKKATARYFALSSEREKSQKSGLVKRMEAD